MSQDFYTQKQVKARKEHKCYWCTDTIQKNELYYRVSEVFEGEFFFRKECVTCNDTISEYWEHDKDGFCESDLSEFWLNNRCRNCAYWDSIDRECTNGDMTHICKCKKFIWEDSK